MTRHARVEALMKRVAELEAKLEHQQGIEKELLKKNEDYAAALEEKRSLLEAMHADLEKSVASRMEALADSNKKLRQEIQERRHAEQALKESEEKYKRLVNCASDGIFIAQNGYAKFPNPKAVQMIGLSAEALSRVPYLDFIHPDDRKLVLDRKVRRRTGEDISSTYTVRIITRKGETTWVQLSAAPITWEGKPATINFLRDITEQKRLERQLQQSQKMEAIGTLAGGIAHDFNNILVPIVSYVDLLQLQEGVGEQIRAYLDKISAATKRAKELVQQILTFCRESQTSRKPIALQSVIDDSLKLLRASIPTTITFEKKICAEVLSILGDPVQIQRLFMNLCTNAFHAMEKTGGRLVISMDSVVVADRRQTEPPPGDYVRLTVSDTGHGIAPSDMEKIFDPYFTTKSKGKGTGLGLSVVHGIVKNHDGELFVSSRPGNGTTFDIYFPRYCQTIDVCRAEEKQKPLKGSESLLIVDDEVEITEVLCAMLENLGYRVTGLNDSQAALSAFENAPYDYDMVLTDLTMPNMTGEQLAGRIQLIRDDVPIVLCTGYGDGISKERLRLSGIDEYLIKPVALGDLAAVIRNALNRGPKSERRNFPRYTAAAGVVAIPDDDKGDCAQIIDISRGGFAYLCDGIAASDRIERDIRIAIRGIEAANLLDSLKCRLVSMRSTAGGGNQPGAAMRCSMAFVDLTNTHIRQLDHLLQYHTT